MILDYLHQNVTQNYKNVKTSLMLFKYKYSVHDLNDMHRVFLILIMCSIETIKRGHCHFCRLHKRDVRRNRRCSFLNNVRCTYVV